MILTCPSCGTQYVVKDGAIPPEGRQVRCAACKHSWHQDPEAEQPHDAQPEVPTDIVIAPERETEPAAVAEERDETDESLAEATLIEPRSGPEAEQRAYEEATAEGEMPTAEASSAVDEAATTEPESESQGAESVEAAAAPPSAAAAADWGEPPVAEAAPDMFSPFAEDAEVARRGRSPLFALLVFIVIVVVAAALFWFLAPTALKAKLGVTAAAATPLQLVTTHMDRTPLESGNGELLTVTGRVINPSAREQDLPPIQAQLKDHQGKVIYSWTIPPPAHSLAAGASTSFNSAEMNVPPGADELTITLGEPKA